MFNFQRGPSKSGVTNSLACNNSFTPYHLNLRCCLHIITKYDNLDLGTIDFQKNLFSYANPLKTLNSFYILFLHVYTSDYEYDQISLLVCQFLKIRNQRINNYTDKEKKDMLLVKQYLRKFAFYYQYFNLRYYPNDLSTLRAKEINFLALQSLFLIHGI